MARGKKAEAIKLDAARKDRVIIARIKELKPAEDKKADKENNK